MSKRKKARTPFVPTVDERLVIECFTQIREHVADWQRAHATLTSGPLPYGILQAPDTSGKPHDPQTLAKQPKVSFAHLAPVCSDMARECATNLVMQLHNDLGCVSDVTDHVERALRRWEVNQVLLTSSPAFADMQAWLGEHIGLQGPLRLRHPDEIFDERGLLRGA